MKLRKGCEIIIATPGRLNDCLVSRYVVLNQCNYIVLDEADRMIDMGFETQVIQILESMPRETLKSEVEEVAELQEKDHRNKFRTTLMFSATMPPEVERLSRNYLRRAGVIYIGVVGRAVDRIKQNVVFVKSDHEKKSRLEQLLREGPPPPIIIFVNQRKTCDNIAKYINKLAYRVTTLQGGRSQDQRDWSLSEFREGRYDILVATDIAGRGLDVKGVTHVINYDLPKNIEQYTHRIGRTGRAGESGLATSFFTNDDAEILYDLKKMLQDTENSVPHELASHPEAQMKPGGFVAQSRRDTVIYVS
jgi:ATP-dependent RNA helicase DDX23/PRP28